MSSVLIDLFLRRGRREQLAAGDEQQLSSDQRD
jgi:hypothetical protein